MNFKRPHHQSIALVLYALEGQLLRENACFFGGGTAITLRFGEYRESIDIDFLVSDISCYRNLRQLLTSTDGVNAIARRGVLPFEQIREVRADQYGIRTMLAVAGKPVKFEIVLEGRILLTEPGTEDTVCGITTLAPLDMVTSKLLANSDRWADDGVFNRDLIDLAMMSPSLQLLNRAVSKAEGAYGKAVLNDLAAAIQRAQLREGWLERCMEAMSMSMPKALLWKRIRALQKIIPSRSGPSGGEVSTL